MSTRPPQIAFVAIHDPSDPHSWSGIPASVLSQLTKLGAEVEIIGPLSRRMRYLLSVPWAWAKIRNRAYQTEREPLVTASYTRQMQRMLGNRRFDAILSLEPLLVSRLERPEPITFWSDAVWDLMANYYYHNPSESFHSKAKMHEEKALTNVRRAVYSSDWAAQAVKKLYNVADKKVAVLPFGPNLEITHDLSRIQASWSEKSKDECILLFLGVDWERKGGQIALDAARLLNQNGVKTRLVVAGCYVPGDKPHFVTEVGFISKSTAEGRARLAELLLNSHFLILPTRAECAGIVFCEASAFGLPTVTTDTGGISTYIRQGANGLRLPLSADAEMYAESISRVYRDVTAYQSMSAAGWAEYRGRLNWESSVSKLLALMLDEPVPGEADAQESVLAS